MDPRIEKVLKLPARIRVLIVAGLVVLIGVGFFFLIYSPTLDEYNQAKQSYATLEQKLTEDRRIAENLPKFQAEYQRMQDRLKEALAELPNEKEIPTLLTNISAMAKDQGLDILRFKPVGEVAKGFYAEVPVEMKLVGAYHDVAMFFFRVGKLSRIVNIGNLNIARSTAKGGGNFVNVECLATTFRFVETPPPAAGAPAKKN